MHCNGYSAAKLRKAKGSTTNHLINGVGNQANGLPKREATEIVDEIVSTLMKVSGLTALLCCGNNKGIVL